MVARSPPKQQRKMVMPPLPIDATRLRETVKKVDQCMARLQELQYTVNGGTKVISGVSLSPRSTRSYLRTSLRCKQETLRNRSTNNSKRSPPGKLPTTTDEDWKRMSLPAMLLGETIGEILQTSQFARNIVEAMTNKALTTDDPKTPLTNRRKPKQTSGEHSELLAKRKREKKVLLQTNRTESDAPSLQRAKSRINFKVSPLRQIECDKENCKYIANRVSPRNRPWARKTVLFPNPLFHSSPTSQHQKLSGKKSPIIARNQQTPHKFLIKSKSPPRSASKLQKSPPLSISPTRVGKKSPVHARNRQTPHKFLIKTPPKLQRSPTHSVSPTRVGRKSLGIAQNRQQTPHKKSPPRSASKLQRSPSRSISPTRVGKKSPKISTAAKLRRSFSPSRLANKLVSPLKSRKSCTLKSDVDMKKISPLKSRRLSINKNDMMRMMSGLKQRPTATTSVRFSPRRI